MGLVREEFGPPHSRRLVCQPPGQPVGHRHRAVGPPVRVIGLFLGPLRPRLSGRQQGGQMSGLGPVNRVFTARSARPFTTRSPVHVVRNLHDRPPVVARLRPPAEAPHTGPRGLGTHTKSLAQVSVGHPFGHRAVSARHRDRIVESGGDSADRCFTHPRIYMTRAG